MLWNKLLGFMCVTHLLKVGIYDQLCYKNVTFALNLSEQK